ncbi:MAG: hypothetical protein QM758_16305 [Armatimonas sp.]
MKILRALPVVLLLATAALAQSKVGDFTIATNGGKILLVTNSKTLQVTLTGSMPTIKSRQKVRDLEISAQKIWGSQRPNRPQ